MNELGINIILSPNLTLPTPLEVCDTYTNMYDGIGLFNLDNAEYQNLDKIQSIVVHYFENYEDINQEDPLNYSLAITNPNNYASGSKTIYIKATNTLTECLTILPLKPIVNSPLQPNNINTVELCYNDTNSHDLSFVKALLLDSNTVDFDFYSDSNFTLNLPGNVFTYSNIGDYIIYVRITNRTTLYDVTTSFNLRIKVTPIAFTPPNLVTCSDDFDGLYTFDLTQNNYAILGAQNPATHTITYYNNLANAEAGINAINNSYAAIDGPVIYARIVNNLDCYNITQFTRTVNPLPIIPIKDIFPLCVNDLPLVIDASTGNPDDTYLWSTGETTPQIALGLGDAGNDYWVTVIRTYTNAPTCEFTKTFSVLESSIAHINFTATVDFSDPNNITVDVSGIGDYVYILDGGEPQTSNVFENVSLGNHTVTVRDLYGCRGASQTVTVFDIPKFVTPNNDGYFDPWHVVDFTQLPGTMVLIMAYIYRQMIIGL